MLQNSQYHKFFEKALVHHFEIDFFLKEKNISPNI
jgi:hypothetical protein